MSFLVMNARKGSVFTPDNTSGLWYQTSFESGSLTPTYGSEGTEIDGAWAWASGMDGTVSNTRSFTGSYGLSFSYLATSSSSPEINREQRFWIGSTVNEFAFEFMWYVPSNYAHRLPSTGIANNKLFQVWCDNYLDAGGGMHWGGEIMRSSDTSSGFKPEATGNYGTFVGQPSIQNWPMGTTFISPSGPVVPGTWSKLRFYLKPASSRGATDGVYKMWINDSLFMDGGGDCYARTNGTTNVSVKRGYLMGYSNSGYDTNTTFVIDDLKFYIGNPGW